MNGDRDLTVVSLFCGSGGSSLGYREAGFRELIAVDILDRAIENMRVNFPETEVIQEDVATLDLVWRLSKMGVKVGELDVLDGSPPCQGFSYSGHRDVKDSRNELVGHYATHVQNVMPRAFVMENVPGIVTAKHKGIVREAMNRLSREYEIQERIMSAANYGVPQDRKRYIAVGTRKDLGIHFRFPEPFGTMRTFSWVVNEVEKNRNKFLPGDFDEKPLGRTGHGKTLSLTAPFRNAAETSKKYLGINSGFNWSRADMKRPLPTLVGALSICHSYLPRYLTIAELKVGSSFPPEFFLGGSMTDKVKAMGLCVPPGMIKAVAEQLAIELRRIKP